MIQLLLTCSPPEVSGEVYSYLTLPELRTVCLVSSYRNQIINDLGLKRKAIYRDLVFNSLDWMRYTGKDVDKTREFSSLPLDIFERFNRPCRVFQGKRVGNTHRAVWVPKTIGKESLTLNSYERALRGRFPGNLNGYRSISPLVAQHLGDAQRDRSRWILTTKGILPRGDNGLGEYRGQVRALDGGSSYEVPKALEAVVSLTSQYFKEGRRPDESSSSYTVCQERVNTFRVAVGGFSDLGPSVEAVGPHRRLALLPQKEL